MKLQLSDKVIVVTGGSGLIGRNFVSAIVENGGTAVIADIDQKSALETMKKLSKTHGMENMDTFKLDITSSKSINAAINYVKRKYGRIDGVVNAAYPRTKSWGKSFEDVSYKNFCDNVNLQLGGAFLVSQQFGSFFAKQGYGNIINLSSIYGVIAPRFEIYGGAAFHGTRMGVPIEYAAIKSAIIHMTKFMAKYYKKRNIRVNCITPGGVFDNQPGKFLRKYNYYGMSKGMISAEDLKGALVYLLSDGSQCVNGQNIIVDDGWTL